MVQQDHNWQNKASLKKVKKEINWIKVWSNNKTNLGHFAVRYWKICLYAYISNEKWQKLGNECYCKDWFSFPIQIMELGFHETVSYSRQSMFLCKAVVFVFCFPFIHLTFLYPNNQSNLSICGNFQNFVYRKNFFNNDIRIRPWIFSKTFLIVFDQIYLIWSRE